MPPRAISSPSRYRAAGLDAPAGMPTPPARSAAASGSAFVAAGSLVRGGASRGGSGLAVPFPEVAGHTAGHSSPRSGGPRRAARSILWLTLDERDRLVERRSARTLGRYRDALVPDRHAAVEDEPVPR